MKTFRNIIQHVGCVVARLLPAVALCVSLWVAEPGVHAAEIKGLVRLVNIPKEATSPGVPILGEADRVGPNGGLADCLAFVSKGLDGRTFNADTQALVLQFAGGRFEQQMVVGMVGNVFTVHSEDTNVWEIWFTTVQGGGFLLPQKMRKNLLGPGDSTFPFPLSEPQCYIPIWANKQGYVIQKRPYLSVFDHPFFAVSDTNGSFVISGDLPDGNYEVTVDHSLRGRIVQPVTINGGKAAVEADLEYPKTYWRLQQAGKAPPQKITVVGVVQAGPPPGRYTQAENQWSNGMQRMQHRQRLLTEMEAELAEMNDKINAEILRMGSQGGLGGPRPSNKAKEEIRDLKSLRDVRAQDIRTKYSRQMP